MAINKVMLAGNLTQEPVLKRTASGTAVLQMGIAVNDRVQDGQGGYMDKPNFFDMTMFGSRAEGVSKYLHKGMKVAVAGKLHYSKWEANDEQGGKQTRSKVEVWVDDIEFMSQREAAPAVNQAPSSQYQQGAVPPMPMVQAGGFAADSDIPF